MIKVESSFTWNGDIIKVKGKKVVNKSAYEIGLIVEGHAKVLCPRKTDRLAGSITTQARDHGNNVKAPATASDKITAPGDDMEVYVGTAVDYGPYVEFGTRNAPAQPFLRPALDLAQGKVLSICMKEGRMEFKDYLK